MGEPRTPRFDDLTRHRPSQPGVAWWRAGAIFGVAVLLALIGADVFWLLVEPLTLILVAIVIAQALAPVVRYANKVIPRTIAVILVYLALVLVLALMGWLFLPTLVSEGQAILTDLPKFTSRARSWLSSLNIPGGGESSNQVIAWAETMLMNLSGRLSSLPMTIFSSLIDVILVIFMSAYWLIFTPALRRFTLSLFPQEKRPWVDSVLDEMGATMGGFVRGTLIDAAAIGILVYIGLTIIGVQYVLLLAILSGFGELIPIIGPILSAVPAVLVAFMESPTQAAIVIVFFLVLQQLESNLLVPLIMRNQADVPPLLSLVAVVIGAALGGILAAILAIPVFGALRILIVRIVAPAERDWTGVEDAPNEVGTEEEEAPQEILDEVDDDA